MTWERAAKAIDAIAKENRRYPYELFTDVAWWKPSRPYIEFALPPPRPSILATTTPLLPNRTRVQVRWGECISTGINGGYYRHLEFSEPRRWWLTDHGMVVECP